MRRLLMTLPLSMVALMLLGVGCDDGRPPPGVRPDSGAPPICDGRPEGVVCVGDSAATCDGMGGETSREDCAALGQTCAPRVGCRLCAPSTISCDGEMVMRCTPEGDGFVPGETCDTAAGLHCGPAGCQDLCADAEESESYIGCEYWPVTTRNSQLAAEFEFAVVIANPSLVAAEVFVERMGAEVARTTVAPGQLETVTLPWVEALRNPEGGGSALVRGGAYRLESEVPVTVYQFNPLEYQREGDCATEPEGMVGDGRCYSFSNDASLLLPTHVLTGSYVTVARPTSLLAVRGSTGAIPGFVSIVGASGTPVEVSVTTRANVLPSDDGAVNAMSPGMTETYTLGAGDVLQLSSGVPAADCPTEWVADDNPDVDVQYCPLGPEWDLTGTELRATGPIAVIGGHDCTFVPFDKWACDHLEEAIFPVESLGNEVIVARTRALRGEPNLLRIVSASDDNRIELAPPLRGALTLDRGDFFEVELEEAVKVTGSGPLLVAQFLVGQDYAGLGSSGPNGNGDPGMALAIPTQQFRSSYTFLAPESFESSFVSVIAPTGAIVILDGEQLGGFREIPDTFMSRSATTIGRGVHGIEASTPFGILVYGYGRYTSYFYPGGLDFRLINPPI